MTHALSLVIPLLVVIPSYARPQGGALPCGRPSFEEADVIHSFSIAKSGETIELECKHEFYRASPKSTCLNGQWSEPNPSCKYVDCPAFGYLENGNHTFNKRNRGVSAKVTFICNEGYWLEGSGTRVCQRDGQWSGREVRCTEVQCPEPQLPPGGKVTQQPPYRFNEEVGISCNKDYVFTGQPIKCQNDNTWSSGHTGNCVAQSSISCAKPTQDSQIKITPKKDHYAYNAKIRLFCEEGFYFSGSKERMCLANSSWSGLGGNCHGIICPQTRNEILKGNVEDCDPCPYNTTLTVTCEVGYVYSGDAVICGQDGTWKGKIGTCEGVGCGSVPVIENGFIVDKRDGKFNDKREVKCREGFDYNGPGSILCGHDGKWSYPGDCKENEPIVGTVIPIFVALIILVVIITFIVYRWRRHKDAERLKVKIREGGHMVENKVDKKIDLDKEFIQLRLASYTDIKTPKWANDNVPMDKYINFLENYELLDTTVDKLIENMEGGGVILMHGRAGVGKTTLVQKLVHSWSKEDWAKDYGAVFVYNMRYISPKDKRPMTLAEFLDGYMMYRPKRFYPTISKGVSVEGERWIIFMDAIDEFPDLMTHLDEATHGHAHGPFNKNSQCFAHEWCTKIWTRSVLSKAIIILTSRHIKGLQTLDPKKAVEVIGLTPKTIREMVDNQLSDQAEKLHSILDDNQILLSVSSITFFCMMLCNSFKADDKFEDHTNRLKTYTRITAFLIQSFIKRKTSDKVYDEKSPLVQQEMDKLRPLSKLAYLGLVENKNDTNLAQLVFNEKDIGEAGVTETDLNFAQELGLIVCTDFHEPGQKSKGSLITEFMHLSIQELLAMGYLLSQGKAKATQIFNNMWTTKRFHMAQLYLFGFCYDDGIDPDGINLVVYISDQETSNELKQDLLEALLQNAAKDRMDRHQVLRAIQIAYETQSPEVAKQVSAALFQDDRRIALRDMPLTAVDILGIIFMVNSSTDIRELRLERVTADEGSLAIISNFLKTDDTLTELSLEGVALTEKSFQSLVDGVSENSTLKSICLAYTNINNQMMTDLANVLKVNETLEELSIANNDFTYDGFSKVLHALCQNKSLKKLVLDTQRLDWQYISVIGFLLSKNKTIQIKLMGPDLSKEVLDYINDHDPLKDRIYHNDRTLA